MKTDETCECPSEEMHPRREEEIQGRDHFCCEFLQAKIDILNSNPAPALTSRIFEEGFRQKLGRQGVF